MEELENTLDRFHNLDTESQKRPHAGGKSLLFGSNENICAFNLDLENRFWRLSRPPLYFAGCKVESRPVPRTFNHVAFQSSLGKWSSHMRAGVPNSIVFARDACQADWLALVLDHLHLFCQYL